MCEAMQQSISSDSRHACCRNILHNSSHPSMQAVWQGHDKGALNLLIS